MDQLDYAIKPQYTTYDRCSDMRIIQCSHDSRWEYTDVCNSKEVF